MKTLSETLKDIKPIEGFHVMEWLRGVRDANYELSINDPEKYRKEEEKSKKHIRLLRQRRTKNNLKK